MVAEPVAAGLVHGVAVHSYHHISCSINNYKYGTETIVANYWPYSQAQGRATGDLDNSDTYNARSFSVIKY